MRGRSYFPLGIADRSAFCNRVKETSCILGNIDTATHTLVMAPRRYGKTSLCLHAIKKSELAFVEVDFFMVPNEHAVASYILKAVGDLIGRAIGAAEKLIAKLASTLKHMCPKLVSVSKGFSIELAPNQHTDPTTLVMEALLTLEKLLANHEKKAVLLFDEFQAVGVVAKGSGVEAAIRHVAQKTKYLSFIFSGSNRHLLQTMFEDSSRPLYNLTFRVTIGLISEKDYAKHIDKAAKVEWGEVLPTKVRESIFELSRRHPYYINKLCNTVWAYSEELPTIKSIHKAWKMVLEEGKSEAVRDVSQLSLGQKAVLRHIARGNINNLQGKAAVKALDMQTSSIGEALSILKQKDIVEEIEGEYRIISPLIAHFASI